MGQENSLNCRTGTQQKSHQIETTQQNALELTRTINQKKKSLQTSDVRSKKSSLKTESEIKSISQIQTQSKPPQYFVPEHQNVIKVALQPFPNSEQSPKNKKLYQQKMGKCLAQIIQSRYNTAMHFPHKQIISLIESLVYSLSYFDKNNYQHHDYYPTNIYYSNGIFKISNPLTTQVSGYTLTQQRKRFSFLSPEQISEILEDTKQEDISPEIMNKSDIFSIGMIILQFCTLQPSSQCYDQESYSIIDTTIKERLSKIQKIYSPAIADCVKEMLQYQVDRRMTPNELGISVFLNSQKQKQKANEQEIQQQQNRMGMSVPHPKQQVRPPGPIQVQQQLPMMQQPGQMIQQLPPGMIQTPQGQFIMVPPDNQQIRRIPPPGVTNIAVPTPNYIYSRIGPNNQGLLSPTTLQNKLRVIQQIHEKPVEEDESEGTPSNLLPTNSLDPTNSDIYQGQKQGQFEKDTRKVEERKYLAKPEPNIQSQPQPQLQVRQVYQVPPLQQYGSPSVQTQKYSQPLLMSHKQPQYFQKQTFQQQNKNQTNQFLPQTRYVTSSPKNDPSLNKYAQGQYPNETLEERVERILQMSRNIK